MRVAQCAAAAIVALANFGLFAQTQSYIPSNVTGQLVLTRAVNPQTTVRALGAIASGEQPTAISRVPTQFPHPSFPRLLGGIAAAAILPIQSLPVIASGGFGFN